jgi:phage N-6-adenine-methyltransferase
MFTQEFKAAAFSSATGKWDTPQTVVDDLATIFDWDLDVCASRDNVCESYFNESENALLHQWGDWQLRWMNPPYGREIGRWMEAARETDKGVTVCLVPARTDTRWWQNNIRFASQIVFIKGRLKFGNATNSAPFPSAFVVFGNISERQRDKLAEYGWSILQAAS